MAFSILSMRSALPPLLAWTLLGQAGCAPDHPASSPPTDGALRGEGVTADDTEHSAGAPDASGARPKAPVSPVSSASSDAGLAAAVPRDAAAQVDPTQDAGNAAPAELPHAADAGSDLGGASTHGATSDPASTDAMSAAYAAMTRGDKTALDGALVALDAAQKAHPDDGHLALYAGTMRLWKMSEGALGVADLLRSPSLPDQIVSQLERARALIPNDFRVPGFLGLAQVNMGLLTSNQPLLDEGLATLDQAIVQFPAYGHFLRAASTSGLAKDDPLFSQALTDLVALTKECRFDEGNAETAFVYPSDPSQTPSPHVCLDDGIVPHVWEGIFILFGDLALKAGWDTPRALAIYRSAQTAPAYKTWPFAGVLEQRIAQAAENARLFADQNPLNDPGLWVTSGHICTGCHQEH